MVEAAFKFGIKSLLLIVLFVGLCELSSPLIRNLVYEYITFEKAVRITKTLEGEPITEAYETVHDYASVLVNSFMSILIYSVVRMIIDLFQSNNVLSRKKFQFFNGFIRPTSLRIFKVFFIMFIFWRLFYFPPYEYFADKYPSLLTPIIITSVITNILLTTAIYKGCTLLWRRVAKSFPSKRLTGRDY